MIFPVECCCVRYLIQILSDIKDVFEMPAFAIPEIQSFTFVIFKFFLLLHSDISTHRIRPSNISFRHNYANGDIELQDVKIK
jgi:hypothetical protein